MKFVYPTDSIHLDDTNAQTKMTMGSFGKFPLTAFNAWHGGVHIGSPKQSLQAIADGHVIAFRMTEDYEIEVYDFEAKDTEDEACRQQLYKRLYSKAFVLIQHDYKSPIGQQLRYYSLYHHVMPVSPILGTDAQSKEEKKAHERKEQREKDKFNHKENERKKKLKAFDDQEKDRKITEAKKRKQLTKDRDDCNSKESHKASYIVTARNPLIIRGLNAYYPEQKNQRVKVIPKGDYVKRFVPTQPYMEKAYPNIFIYKGTKYFLKGVSLNHLRYDEFLERYEIVTTEDSQEDHSQLGTQLRDGASANAGVLTRIAYGTKLTSTQVQGDWIEVTYNGQRGFLSITDVKREENEGKAEDRRQYSTQTYKVTANDKDETKGIWAKSPKNNKVGNTSGENVCIIPNGTIVEHVEKDESITVKNKYQRIQHDGGYYYVKGDAKTVQSIGNNQYRINASKAMASGTVAGARVYEQQSKTSKILKIIASGTDIDLIENLNGEDWLQTTDGLGYIHKNSVARVKSEEEEALSKKTDRVIIDPLIPRPLPDFMSKKAYKVKAENGMPLGKIVSGLNARREPLKKGHHTAKQKLYEKKFVIPTGTIVTLDPISPPISNIRNGYIRVKFTDIDGIVQEDIYIYELKDDGEFGVKQVIDNANQLEIIETRDTLDEDRTHIGARVYETPDKSAPVIAIQEWGEIVAIDDTYTAKKEWKKLADGSGFVATDDLEYTTTYDSEKYPYGDVHALFHPVKAGELIGYTGKFGHKTSPEDDLAHFEVFTDDENNLCSFLNNEAVKQEEDKQIKDGEDTLRYKIEEGATLITNLTKSVQLKANTPVKVIQKNGDFVKVKVIEHKGVLIYEKQIDSYKRIEIKNPEGHSFSAYYKIANGYLADVQEKFHSNVNASTKLYFNWTIMNSSHKDTYSYIHEKKRHVIFYPELYNQEFWIKKNQVDTTTYYENLSLKETFKIKTEINRVYIKEPKPEPEEPITINKTKILTNKKFEEAEGETNEIWYKIKLTEEGESGKNIEKEGWIKKTDPKLSTLNPFDWSQYGFSQLDAGNEYIYSVEDYNEQKNTSDFIQALWSKLDCGAGTATGDGKITKQEIDNAYYNIDLVNQLSKYICKHKNEWSYTCEEIEREVSEFLEIQIKKEKKKDLSEEAKKLLDDKKSFILDKLTEKAENLMWWQDVQHAKYTPPEPPAPTPTREEVVRSRYIPQVEVPESYDTVKLQDGKHREDPILVATTPQENEYTTEIENTPVTAETSNTATETVTATTIVETPNTATEVTTPVTETLPERTLPTKEANVWHFHPLAFIKQMRLMYGTQTTGECYCNRDFTVEEFKNIFTRLRRSEAYNLKILNGDNCKIPDTDKNLERLTEEFNKAMNKYKINECIQKIHFIAQTFWESDRLKTGLEYASGNYYNPNGGHAKSKQNGNTQFGDGPKYKGRGFMQLTWRKTQMEYLKHAAKFDGDLKGKSDVELELRSNNYETYISDNLHYAIDSAGWYWSNYRKASAKHKEISGKSLNDIALFGDKYQQYISTLVNGGDNGKEERQVYYKKLKRFFKLNKCINIENKSKLEFDNSNTPWISIALEELGVEEIYGIDYNDPRVLEYHKTAGYTKELMGRDITDDWIGKYKDAWCGSFVYWCYFKSGIKKEDLNKTGYNAFSWNKWGIESDKKEPCYGAIAVCDYSHVGFVVGLKGEKVVLLGGNQTGGDSSTKGMVCYTTVNKSSIVAYRYPKNFNLENINYDLEEVSTNSGSDNFDTSR